MLEGIPNIVREHIRILTAFPTFALFVYVAISGRVSQYLIPTGSSSTLSFFLACR